MGPYDKLNALIESWQAEIVASVQKSVQIPSVAGAPTQEAPNGLNVRTALIQSLNLGKSMGFCTKMLDNLVGFVEYGQGTEMVAVLGHLDVVPAGEGWTTSPFAGTIQGNCIYGRGSVDDKGPIIGALYALKAIKESGLPIKRRIRVIFGTDEETNCTDMARYKLSEELPVSGFTPDGQYPAINAEKGILTIKISCNVGSQTQLQSAEGGNATNTVPDQASLHYLDKDGKLHKLCFRGKTAHSSLPHLGQNAIAMLAEEVKKHELAAEEDKAFRFIREKIGFETNGNSLKIQYEDTKSGPLTCNLAMLSYERLWLTWIIDIRYPVTMDGEVLISTLKRQIEKEGFCMSVLTHRLPLYIPEDDPIIQSLGKAYQQQTQKDFKPIGVGGGTYAKSLPNIVAFGPVFPGEQELCHLPDEYISITDLVKNVEIMAAAIWELAQ